MNYLIAGLGNIGQEYSDTRHNAGFMVLDAWAQASNTVFTTQRYGDVAEVSFKGRKITLLKPSTYMNLSGNAVRYWMTKLKLPVENLLVICDDLNIPFGTLRMRKKGSDGGHNGLKNIQELLGTQDYARIRVGIGNDFQKGGQVDFVLGKLDGPVRLPESDRARISLLGHGCISRDQQGQQNADLVSFHISVHVMRTLNCSATMCKITDYI